MTGRSLRIERWLYTGLVASTTMVAAVRLWNILRVDGMTPLKLTLFVFFISLFAWIASSFWLAALGAWLRRTRISVESRASSLHDNMMRPATGAMPAVPGSRRTAIVMPIYNEDAAEVFARIEAMHESLGAAGSTFDFFLLSDSTDAGVWINEELEWDRLRRTRTGGARIFYRHRLRNEARKSGNIRDFCENWGAAYEYMVVLDADSLMTGETLLELVRRMDEYPGAALIQVPPLLIGRSSLFARIQQFASSVYGPLYWEGLARLQGTDGNYWGHNAIIRVRPFMQNCGLPKLPGRAPLGGEILSHDFVEAAMLRKADWDILMAPDLSGSYEEPPPGLVQHVRRDRRWCEGNLQHIRLIAARGFRTASRLHLAVGVMSYLSAPIWLVMILVSVIEIYRDGGFTPFRFEGRYPVLGAPNAHPLEFAMLALVAALLLYGPKMFALVVLARDPIRLRAHGGALKALQSVFWESVFSTLLAPVVMLSHAGFVLRVFLGHSARWSAQKRSDGGLGLRAVARAFAVHTFAGIVAAVLAWYYIPGSLPWLLPLLLGLLLAIPLAAWTASPSAGNAARRLGLFLVPNETVGIPIIERFKSFADRRNGERIYTRRTDLPELALQNPFVNALHLALLRDVLTGSDEAGASSPPFSDSERGRLLCDPERLGQAPA